MEPCIWFSALHILGVLVHAYNPRTQAVDGGGRVVLQEPQESKAHLWLCREFETNLEYTKLCFKEQGAVSGEESWSSSLMASEGSGFWLSRWQSADFLISV